MSVAVAKAPENQVEKFLSRFGDGPRAEVVHAGLIDLRGKSDEIFIITAELVWEVHTKEHWRRLRDDTGRPYIDEDTYREDVLGLASRNAENYQRIGRMISMAPTARRAQLRLELCEIGISKAVAIAPAIERVAASDSAVIDEWVGLARRLAQRDLRRVATKRLGLKPHGTRPPKIRFIAAVISRGVPEELAASVYDAGAKIHGHLGPDKMLVHVMRAALSAWRSSVVKRQPA